MYCAEALVDAFPDARIVQIIRDGRDVVAGMLGDAQTLSFVQARRANVDSEFPNPFFGIETEQDLAAWPELSPAGKCAMRWRGSVRKMARLRTSAGRRAADHAALRGADPAPRAGHGGGVGVHRRAAGPIAVRGRARPRASR